MKFGKNTNLFIFLTVLMLFSANAYSLEKIQSAPVINLEDISPTFEEEKDELEKEEKEISQLMAESHLSILEELYY